MVGCVHNVERLFIYPEMAKIKGKLSFLAEDMIKLVCPYGCDPIYIRLKDSRK